MKESKIIFNCLLLLKQILKIGCFGMVPVETPTGFHTPSGTWFLIADLSASWYLPGFRSLYFAQNWNLVEYKEKNSSIVSIESRVPLTTRIQKKQITFSRNNTNSNSIWNAITFCFLSVVWLQTLGTFIISSTISITLKRTVPTNCRYI